MAGILKIVLTGPESSGKSVMAQQLATHFKVPWVPEYARIHLEKAGPEYDYELVCQMARHHWEWQQEHIRQAKDIIILDTDLINYVIWQRAVFGRVDPWIMDQVACESDHRYLICFPDIPWESDPLRENPHGRLNLFDQHQQEISSRQRPHEVLTGNGAMRLENAKQLFVNLAGLKF